MGCVLYLLTKAPHSFSPDVVWDLTEEAVERLGSEDETTVKESADVTKKLGILEKGLQDLDTFTVRFGVKEESAFSL